MPPMYSVASFLPQDAATQRSRCERTFRRRSGDVALYVHSTLPSSVWSYSADDRTFQRLSCCACMSRSDTVPSTAVTVLILLAARLPGVLPGGLGLFDIISHDAGHDAAKSHRYKSAGETFPGEGAELKRDIGTSRFSNSLVQLEESYSSARESHAVAMDCPIGTKFGTVTHIHFILRTIPIVKISKF